MFNYIKNIIETFIHKNKQTEEFRESKTCNS